MKSAKIRRKKTKAHAFVFAEKQEDDGCFPKDPRWRTHGFWPP